MDSCFLVVFFSSFSFCVVPYGTILPHELIPCSAVSPPCPPPSCSAAADKTLKPRTTAGNKARERLIPASPSDAFSSQQKQQEKLNGPFSPPAAGSGRRQSAAGSLFIITIFVIIIVVVVIFLQTDCEVFLIFIALSKHIVTLLQFRLVLNHCTRR